MKLFASAPSMKMKTSKQAKVIFERVGKMRLAGEIARQVQRVGARLSPSGGDGSLKRYQEQAAAVNALEPPLRAASDEQLRDEAATLTRRAQDGTPPSTLAVEYFALVREVARRTVGMRPFDVQVIGGLGLHDGRIVQMDTGEGKTLAAVSPVALRALDGQGSHVLTFNDYLARRDAEWMGPIYRFLGLTVGYIQEGMSRAERRKAYLADVTYLTAKEAGFDFLGDNLVYEVGEVVHRPLRSAIVDEADSILIDEARVPMVIAGSSDPELGEQQLARATVEQLQPKVHYAIDEEGRNVYLTEAGSLAAENLLRCGDLYATPNLSLLTELNLALHAEALMHRDVDYIVRDGRVEIVDEFTGRVVRDRHWPHGLQTAIEAKEGLRTSEAGRVMGSITLQHFLGRYSYLGGMTATAAPSAEEIFARYGLELLVVPPNRPCIRRDYPDYIFPDKEAKEQAVLAEIEDVHSKGQPVLVGTTSVAASETLAAALRKAGIGCNVLNARRDEYEANIVAEAGALHAVTISTNMAGRGTDIRLGGRHGRDHDRVAALGGLQVIGTNRHESRRIDDQLRGRAGRQGDPGSSRFFISLEDDLLQRFGNAASLTRRLRTAMTGEAVDNPILCRLVGQVQRIAEGRNYDIRHSLWRYSRLVEGQRRIVHDRRRQVLEGIVVPDTLLEHRPSIHERLRQRQGGERLRDLERRVMLKAIDDCWSRHLATVTEIRDGIHLAEVGGLDPYREFLKLATDSFRQALDDIDAQAIESFVSLENSTGGIDLEEMGLRGPSSTWTYLVNDQALADRLGAALIGGRNIGLSVGAALTGPLLLLWALSSRFRSGRASRQR